MIIKQMSVKRIPPSVKTALKHEVETFEMLKQPTSRFLSSSMHQMIQKGRLELCTLYHNPNDNCNFLNHMVMDEIATSLLEIMGPAF